MEDPLSPMRVVEPFEHWRAAALVVEQPRPVPGQYHVMERRNMGPRRGQWSIGKYVKHHVTSALCVKPRA